MVVDSILPHAEFDPNHYRKDAPQFKSLLTKNRRCSGPYGILPIVFLAIAWLYFILKNKNLDVFKSNRTIRVQQY